MDPLSLILGAGTSLAGGLMGAGAQEDAAEKNYQINLMNYYLRNQERQDRINAAAEQQMEQHEGATDANGNRMVYVPGKGWQVILSPDQEGIRNAQNAEQTARLGIDLPMRREQMLRNASQQRDQEFMADNLLKHFSDAPDTETDETNKLKLAMQTGINQNYDQATQAAAHNSVVTESSNFGNILKQMAQGRSADMAKAFAAVPMQAKQIADRNNAQHDSQLSNLYSFFSGKSSQMPQVAYAPQDTSTQANSLMDRDAGRAASANDKFTDAMGQKGGTLDYIEPNMGFGNAIASFGNVLSSGFGKMNAQNEFDNIYAGLKRKNGGNEGMGLN